jgi:hypothetical protein
MKFFIALISSVLLAGLVIAGPDALTVELVSYPAHTNFVTTTKPLNGSLDSIRLDIGSASISAVSIVVGGEIVFTNTSLSADAIYRPRVGVCNNAGTAYSDVTNAVLTPYVFCNEPAVINWAGTNVAYQTNYMIFKFTDAQ